jgi:hypothetical protein
MGLNVQLMRVRSAAQSLILWFLGSWHRNDTPAGDKLMLEGQLNFADQALLGVTISKSRNSFMFCFQCLEMCECVGGLCKPLPDRAVL